MHAGDVELLPGPGAAVQRRASASAAPASSSAAMNSTSERSWA
jgi:hypothetical protein